MNITILDFAIIAVPLVIVIAALVSRFRARISRQTDEVNEGRKAVLETHIRAIRARADRNLIPQSSSHVARQRNRGGILVRA